MGTKKGTCSVFFFFLLSNMFLSPFKNEILFSLLHFVSKTNKIMLKAYPIIYAFIENVEMYIQNSVFGAFVLLHIFFLNQLF